MFDVRRVIFSKRGFSWGFAFGLSPAPEGKLMGDLQLPGTNNVYLWVRLVVFGFQVVHACWHIL